MRKYWLSNVTCTRLFLSTPPTPPQPPCHRLCLEYVVCTLYSLQHLCSNIFKYYKNNVSLDRARDFSVNFHARPFISGLAQIKATGNSSDASGLCGYACVGGELLTPRTEEINPKTWLWRRKIERGWLRPVASVAADEGWWKWRWPTADVDGLRCARTTPGTHPFIADAPQVSDHKLVLFAPQMLPPGERPSCVEQTHRTCVRYTQASTPRTRNNIVYRVILLKLSTFFRKFLRGDILFWKMKWKMYVTAQ